MNCPETLGKHLYIVHSEFRRQLDRIDPFPGIVVVAAGGVERHAVRRDHVLDLVRRHQLLDLGQIRRILVNVQETGLENRTLKFEGFLMRVVIVRYLLLGDGRVKPLIDVALLVTIAEKRLAIGLKLFETSFSSLDRRCCAMSMKALSLTHKLM